MTLVALQLCVTIDCDVRRIRGRLKGCRENEQDENSSCYKFPLSVD